MSVNGSRALFGYDGSTGNAIVKADVGKGLDLQTNGANSRLLITPAGQVGIGTAPGARLDVSAAATSTVPVVRAASSADPGNGNPAVSFAIAPATNGAILKLEYQTGGGDTSTNDKFTALLINSKTGRFIEGWDTLPVTPVKTLDIDKSGNITASGTLTGNGSGLTNLNGANLTAASVTTDKLAPVYGYFFNTVPVAIPPGGSVPCNLSGPVNGILSGGGTKFTLPDTGVYEVTWQVSINEPGQLVLALNGVEQAATVVGRSTGTTQIVGNVLINATAGDVLNVRNPTGNSAFTITPNAGGTHASTSSLVIKRIK
jgi:hypothetical protein